MFWSNFHVSDIMPFIYKQIDFVLTSPDLENIKKEYGYKRYLNEFGTIGIRMGRRTGHTTAALEILKRYDKSVLIENTGFMCQTLTDKNKNMMGRIVCNIMSLKGNQIDILVIDVASTLSKKKIEKISEHLRPKVLILLG